MSVLPDHRIRRAVADGSLGIEPFRDKQIQPASYDLTLDGHFLILDEGKEYTDWGAGEGSTHYRALNVANEQHYVACERVVQRGGTYELHGFCLASTIEKIRIPSHMVARVEGKSSLARLGLFVHVTAGFIDPGFEGHITLELFCALERGIVLYPGMPIAQISFERMESEAMKPYGQAAGSKYQNAPQGPTMSRYWKNFPLDG